MTYLSLSSGKTLKNSIAFILQICLIVFGLFSTYFKDTFNILLIEIAYLEH